MADYKQMYFTLLDATEQAIHALIYAQRACEELYLLSTREEQTEEKAEIIPIEEK